MGLHDSAERYETKTIHSMEDLICYARELLEKYNTRIWYRGHSNAAYPLIPAILREPYIGFEQRFAMRFYIRAKSRMDAPPHQDDHSAWLAKMQHYGLPTRLLDWTSSPLIAAYFATLNGHSTDKDACIWAMQPRRLNEFYGYEYRIHPMDSKYIKEILEKVFIPNSRMNEHIIACWAIERDLRMVMQQSGFTLHDSCKPIEELPIDNLLTKLIIPCALKDDFSKNLEACGFRLSDLFPDIEHIAMQIKDDCVNKKEY